mmetsp:Transcript_100708/g.260145  ORF Transcript_100708/g.260145 Transcript_100708/m.260145 type:complete len:262 (+) Transcript_100708:1524-2309(+)
MDEVLEVAVGRRLIASRLLEVRGEGLVHVLEDALHREGLRHVLGRVLALHELAEEGHLVRLEAAGAGQRVNDALQRSGGLHVLLQERGGRRRVGVPRLLARRRGVDEHADGLLQGGKRLLCLIGHRHVLGVLLLAEGRGVRLGLQVRPDLLLQLLDLGGQRGDFALELEDGLSQDPHLVGHLFDVLGLAGGGLLAPARILVVDLLLRLFVKRELRLEVLQQVHDTLHGALAGHSPGRAKAGQEAENCNRALHLVGGRAERL